MLDKGQNTNLDDYELHTMLSEISPSSNNKQFTSTEIITTIENTKNMNSTAANSSNVTATENRTKSSQSGNASSSSVLTATSKRLKFICMINIK